MSRTGGFLPVFLTGLPIIQVNVLLQYICLGKVADSYEPRYLVA